MSRFNKNGQNLSGDKEQEWLDVHSTPAPQQETETKVEEPKADTPDAPETADEDKPDEGNTTESKGRRGLSLRRKKGDD